MSVFLKLCIKSVHISSSIPKAILTLQGSRRGYQKHRAEGIKVFITCTLHGTAAYRLGNAIKWPLKLPLKVGQKGKKIRVTDIHKAIFLWPDNRGSFFSK